MSDEFCRISLHPGDGGKVYAKIHMVASGKNLETKEGWLSEVMREAQQLVSEELGK